MVEAISIPKKTSSKVFDIPNSYFYFVVPHTYEHSTQLHTFKEYAKTKSSISLCHEDLNDRNFSRVSSKLEPGKRYMVRIVRVLKKASSTVCVSFLRKQKRLIFVGAQGLTFIQREISGRFPTETATFSFDEKEMLGTENGKTIIPFIHREFCPPASYDWQASVAPWEEHLDEGDCILCVYEI